MAAKKRERERESTLGRGRCRCHRGMACRGTTAGRSHRQRGSPRRGRRSANRWRHGSSGLGLPGAQLPAVWLATGLAAGEQLAGGMACPGTGPGEGHRRGSALRRERCRCWAWSAVGSAACREGHHRGRGPPRDVPLLGARNTGRDAAMHMLGREIAARRCVAKIVDAHVRRRRENKKVKLR